MRADRLLLAVLLLAGAVIAQTTGQIEGVVRDPAGMPTPGTALLITETRTGAQRRLQTDARGSYLAPGLEPGRYEIEASQNSFRMDGIYINDATAAAPSSAAGRLLGLESIADLGHQLPEPGRLRRPDHHHHHDLAPDPARAKVDVLRVP